MGLGAGAGVWLGELAGVGVRDGVELGDGDGDGDGEEDDGDGEGVGVATVRLSGSVAGRTLPGVAEESAAETVKLMACPEAAVAGIASSACSGLPAGPGSIAGTGQAVEESSGLGQLVYFTVPELVCSVTVTGTADGFVDACPG